MAQDSTPTGTIPLAEAGDDRGPGWGALALLAVVNFMVILDSQIVILALPAVTSDLGYSPDGAQWVMSIYLLMFGGLLLLGGRAGDLIGHRRVFLVGVGLFGLASVCCGLAWSPETLVGARALHGLSAALMAPTALGILITTYVRERERNLALAVWGGCGGLGATAALFVGGALTDVVGWRSIFFLNIPVALALLAASPLLKKDGAARKLSVEKVDPGGAVTLALALVTFCFVIVEAPTAGWLSAQTVGLAAVAIGLAAAFYAIEYRVDSPLIPLRLLRARALVGGNAVIFLIGMSAWGVGLLTSVYAQNLLGWTALWYGLGTVAMTLMTLVGSYAAQAALPRLGSRVVAALSVLCLGAGATALIWVSRDGSYVGDLLLGLLLFGIGLGAGSVAASVAALSDASDADAGVASGMSTASFQIGGAFGAAVVTSVLVSRGNPVDHIDGIQAGFVATVVFCLVALLVAVLVMKPRSPRDAPTTVGSGVSDR